MSSIASLYSSGYGSLASTWGLDIGGLNAGNDSSAATATKNASASRTKEQSRSYGSGNTGSLNTLASALSSAMDDMGLSANDRLTFQTLMTYRDQLQSSFTAQVKKDLKALGVDENISFRLTSGSNGSGVSVITDSEDKAVIEKYFEDNPDMVKKFEKLQSLNKMEETRKSNNIDVKALRTRIQMQSMTAWFATDTSSFMAFSGMGASYYSGINTIA